MPRSALPLLPKAGAESTTVMSADCRIDSFTVASAIMGRDIKALVVLPPAYLANDQIRLPILYALHGRKAPHTVWSDMMPLKRALGDQPMIVASFAADAASWYLDANERPDSRFTSFFFAEFLPFIDAAYRTDPKKRGLAGFSMGGFGAVHLMLSRPGTFLGVSSLSGAFNPFASREGKPNEDLLLLLGTSETHPDRYRDLDLYRRLADQATNLPPIYLHCGTEDHLIGEHRRLVEHLATLGLGPDRVTQLESPGKHDWAFWRDASAGVIAFHATIFAR